VHRVIPTQNRLQDSVQPTNTAEVILSHSAFLNSNSTPVSKNTNNSGLGDLGDL
ncbi:hypothetical protein DBR06_SOUSAS34910005, partial [Sousa chinensis]